MMERPATPRAFEECMTPIPPDEESITLTETEQDERKTLVDYVNCDVVKDCLLTVQDAIMLSVPLPKKIVSEIDDKVYHKNREFHQSKLCKPIVWTPMSGSSEIVDLDHVTQFLVITVQSVKVRAKITKVDPNTGELILQKRGLGSEYDTLVEVMVKSGKENKFIYKSLCKPSNYELARGINWILEEKLKNVNKKNILKEGKTLQEIKDDLKKIVNPQDVIIGIDITRVLNLLQLVHPHLLDLRNVFPKFKIQLEKLVKKYSAEETANHVLGLFKRKMMEEKALVNELDQIL